MRRWARVRWLAWAWTTLCCCGCRARGCRFVSTPPSSPCALVLFLSLALDSNLCPDAYLVAARGLPDGGLQLWKATCTTLESSAALPWRVRQTVGDVLLLSQLELVETLDVPPGEAAALLRAASRSVLNAPVTVSESSAGQEVQHSVPHTRKGKRVPCWQVYAEAARQHNGAQVQPGRCRVWGSNCMGVVAGLCC